MESKAIQKELDQIFAQLNVKETDMTWQKMEAKLKDLIQLISTHSETHRPLFINALRLMKDNITSCLLTERTRLSVTTCDFLESTTKLAPSLSCFVNDLFFPSLLKLCGRANKVFVQKATSTLHAILLSSPPEHFLNELFKCTKSPSMNIRYAVAESFYLLLNSKKLVVDKFEPYLNTLESELRQLSQDKTPDVRSKAREAIQIYMQCFPQRSRQFTNSLPPTVQKALGSLTPSNPMERVTTFKRPRSKLSSSSNTSTNLTPLTYNEMNDTATDLTLCSSPTLVSESDVRLDEPFSKKSCHLSVSSSSASSRPSTPISYLSIAPRNSPFRTSISDPATPKKASPPLETPLTPPVSLLTLTENSISLSLSQDLATELVTSNAPTSTNPHTLPSAKLEKNEPSLSLTPSSSINSIVLASQPSEVSSPFLKSISHSTSTFSSTPYSSPRPLFPSSSSTSSSSTSSSATATSTSTMTMNIYSTPKPKYTQNVTMLIMETRSGQPSVRAKAFEMLANVLPTSANELSGYQLSMIECHITNGLYILDSKLVSVVLMNLLRMLQSQVIPSQYYDEILARCLVIRHNPFFVSNTTVLEPCVAILTHFSSSSKYIPTLLAMLDRRELKSQAKKLVSTWLASLKEDPPTGPS